MLLALATWIVVAPAAAAAASVVAGLAPVPTELTTWDSWWPNWSTTIVEPTGMPLVDATLIVVSPAAAGPTSIVGVSVCEYSPDPTRPVSSASNRPTLIVRVGYVPFALYQRKRPWNSAIPRAIPESASNGEPLAQLPPCIRLIGDGLPVCAPLATLVEVGVLSL
jgi:hypothetical protein